MPATNPQPLQAYPIAFHVAVETGAGAIDLANLPWSGKSAAARFRVFVRLLRSSSHPLGEKARASLWSIRVEGGFLLITSRPRPARPVGPDFSDAIDRALAGRG